MALDPSPIGLLPEEWEANRSPDYTKSLGQITQGLSKVVGRLDRASDAFDRDQQNLACVTGTVRGKRKQWEWLATTAAAALMVGLVLSPFAARLLPFGWDAAVAGHDHAHRLLERRASAHEIQ